MERRPGCVSPFARVPRTLPWGLVVLKVGVGISFPLPSVQQMFLEGDPRASFSVIEARLSEVGEGGWNHHVGKLKQLGLTAPSVLPHVGCGDVLFFVNHRGSTQTCWQFGFPQPLASLSIPGYYPIPHTSAKYPTLRATHRSFSPLSFPAKLFTRLV